MQRSNSAVKACHETKNPRKLLVAWAWLLATSALCAHGQPRVNLGEPPLPPAHVSGLPREAAARSVTRGFSVNIGSREEVRAFFNSVYAVSTEVPMDSTAMVSSCFAGTNSFAHADAVARRINWYRAMAGVPATVTLDAGFSQKNQEAALIFAANDALSHFPAASWSCYTANGANAASNSNIALGSAGPEAVDGYIWDSGANNAAAGHRRWLLYPQTKLMGTGDIPAQDPHAAANAIWVFDGNYGTTRPATRQPYVSWPPPGFVPYQTVFGRWSFSYPNANFSAATVFLRSNGVPVSVVQTPPVNGYGENTLLWIPAGLDANGDAKWSRPATDLVYSVTVSNVQGVGTSLFNYTVTVFDPAVPGPGYRPPLISGTNQPAVGQSNVYTFTAVSNAASYQWRQARRSAFNWSDGAEVGLTNFVVNASSGYAVRQNSVVAAGSYAFQLAHPTPPKDQTLRLNRLLLPGPSTVLSFKSRLGWATPDQVAKVQASLDEGVTWQDLYAQAGGNSAGELAFNSRSVSLAGLAGRSVELRFNYHYDPDGSAGYFYQTSPGVGWYLDSLSITNAEELTFPTNTPAATTNFVFIPSQAANYNLEVRPVMFLDFPLEWAAGKQVAAVTNAPPVVITLTQPLLAGSQVRIDFAQSSGAVGTFTLLRADQVTGPWSNDASAVLRTNAPGSYRFTATATGVGKRFYQVRTP